MELKCCLPGFNVTMLTTSTGSGCHVTLAQYRQQDSFEQVNCRWSYYQENSVTNKPARLVAADIIAQAVAGKEASVSP